MLSVMKLFDHDHETALALGKKSVSLNINHSINTALYGVALAFSGLPVEALDTVRRAFRLSPIYPPWYLHSTGRGFTLLGRYDEAIAEFRRAIEMEKAAPGPYFYIARPLCEAGRQDEARQAVSEGLRLNPGAALSNWHRALPYRNPDDLEAELAALRESGMPE